MRTAKVVSRLGTPTISAFIIAAFVAPILWLGQAPDTQASASERVISVQPLNVARQGHTATALADGRILVVGGENAGGILASAEMFDPASGGFSAVGSLGRARVGHTATLLADGRVLVAGGHNARGTLNSVEVYNPATQTFQVVGGMNTVRSGHTATRLSDGKVLIAGGDAAGTAELFDPVTGAFAFLGIMADARSGHTATLFSDSSVFLAGGGNDSAEMFAPASATFTLIPQTMPGVRAGHAAVPTTTGKLLLIGGDSANSIVQFDPATDSFTLAGTLDVPSATATLLANGRILVLGQQLAGVLATGTAVAWEDLTDAAALQRRGHTATELPATKTVLVAGGVDSGDQYVSAAVLFNPAHIQTDLDDYPPDGIVYVAGGGFLPSETVEMDVLRIDGPAGAEWHDVWTTQANANGELFDVTWHVCGDSCLNALLQLTATGKTSGLKARTQFTDGDVPDYCAWISPTSITIGSPVTYTLTVTNLLTVSAQVIASVEVAIPTDGGTPSSVSVVATDPDGTVRTWTVASTAGPMQFSRSGASVNDVDPGGKIEITFTTTITTGGSKEWTTIAYKNNNYQSPGTTTCGQPTVTDGGCGNGTIDAGEQCDLGANNGQPGYCCSATCQFVSVGTECRGAAGVCDAAEQCTGSSDTCPADVNQPDGTSCDDSNACTTGEMCTSGTCGGGSAVSCDDGNVCTDDSCDPSLGCQHANNTAACDDGNACTSGDMCSGGSCIGTAISCDDGNVCTDDSCDTSLGCQHSNNTVACDDGDACTLGDVCGGGTCSGTPTDCSDGNACTTDSCNSSDGSCINTPVGDGGACDDGNACTTGEVCTGGACGGGTAVTCNDGNVCTDDSCNPASGCVYVNNTAACDDGNACTTGDICSGGSCTPGAPLSCDDGNACTTDSCNPVSGCQYAPTACNVTADVQITRGGYARNPGTGRYVQNVTLKNIGSTPLNGPISYVLDALSSNAGLYNKTGTTSSALPAGSPYRNLTATSLAVGASATVTLEFTNPTNAAITYTARVVAGPGPR